MSDGPHERAERNPHHFNLGLHLQPQLGDFAGGALGCEGSKDRRQISIPAGQAGEVLAPSPGLESLKQG